MAKKTQAVHGVTSGALVPQIDQEEVKLTQEIGGTVAAFMAGVVAFFTGANTLEVRALDTLDAARALTMPTNVTDDERLQTFMKRVAADQKEVETYWTITAKVHALHRRLTARRKKAEEPLDAARTIANDLHNRYVQAEQRRVAEAAEAQRRENERQAEAVRQAELDRLEAEALKAEASAPDLSDREQSFVENILAGYDATMAAKRAGYKNPQQIAAQLMASKKVMGALAAERTAAALKLQRERVKEQPLDVADVQVEAPQVGKNATDRTTWSGEVLDAEALINAVIEGKLGVPRDVLMVNPVKLNEYARSLHEIINRWPGVRANKNTRSV